MGRFLPKDLVATVTRLGAGLDKKRIGSVLAIGNKGVQVRFMPVGMGREEVLWKRANELYYARYDDEKKAWEVSKDRFDEPTLLSGEESFLHEEPVQQVQEVIPVKDNKDEAARVSPTLVRMEAAGIDPFEAWVAMGKEILERKKLKLTEAEQEVKRMEQEVRDAESLVGEARKKVAKAVAEADRERRQYNEMAIKLGGNL